MSCVLLLGSEPKASHMLSTLSYTLSSNRELFFESSLDVATLKGIWNENTSRGSSWVDCLMTITISSVVVHPFEIAI